MREIESVNDVVLAPMLKQRHHEAGLTLAKRLVTAMPNSPELWANVASFFWCLCEYEQAEAAARRSLAINANYVFARGTLALILASLGKFDEAETHYAFALSYGEADSHHLDYRWNLAQMRLARGDYAGGLPLYESRFQRRPDVYKAMPAWASKEWQGEALDGKSLYVLSEQGMGDTILWSRFLPQLIQRGAKVFMTTSPMLQALLWEFTSPGVTFLPEGLPLPRTDFFCRMGSLPYRLGITEATIPADPGYISARVNSAFADGDIVQFPSDLEADTANPIKIGLCWAGNPAMDRDRERRVELEDLLEICANPRAWCYSLQVGAAASDVYRLGADRMIQEFSSRLAAGGLVGTGTVIRRMDLVITSCTAVAHLAGALGVPTWLMLCSDPYWIWGRERIETPWYPSIRLFRQKKPGDWKGVIREVCEALKSFDPRALARAA